MRTVAAVVGQAEGVNPFATFETLAAPRGGIVSRGELLSAGWSSSRIDRARSRGLLLPVVRGVYRVAGVPFTRRAAQHTAILAAGTDAHLGAWSAAELLDIAERRPGPLELIVPHGMRAPAGSRGLLRVSQTRALPPVDRVEVDGIAATAGHRTLIDLAARTSTARLAELVAASLRSNACTIDQIRGVLDRRVNARGRGRLVAAVELLGDDGGRSRSDVEVAVLNAIVTAGLPRPDVAYRVRDARGRFLAEVDLAFPDHRIAVEIDGYAWHSTPARKRADEIRQNRLVLAGWTVLRFSASSVRRDPASVVTAIQGALATAGLRRVVRPAV